MNPQFVKEIAETILQQIVALTRQDVLDSWGIEPPAIACTHKDMAAVKFKVNGRIHKGLVIIAYNEGIDYYEIYLQNGTEEPRIIAEDVDFTQLGDIIDEAIESGTDKGEYEKFCEGEHDKFMQEIFK